MALHADGAAAPDEARAAHRRLRLHGRSHRVQGRTAATAAARERAHARRQRRVRRRPESVRDEKVAPPQRAPFPEQRRSRSFRARRRCCADASRSEGACPAAARVLRGARRAARPGASRRRCEGASRVGNLHGGSGAEDRPCVAAAAAQSPLFRTAQLRPIAGVPRRLGHRDPAVRTTMRHAPSARRRRSNTWRPGARSSRRRSAT